MNDFEQKSEPTEKLLCSSEKGIQNYGCYDVVINTSNNNNSEQTISNVSSDDSSNDLSNYFVSEPINEYSVSGQNLSVSINKYINRESKSSCLREVKNTCCALVALLFIIGIIVLITNFKNIFQ